MKKSIFYILFISLFFSSCDLKTAEEYYNSSIDLEEQGLYSEAIISLNKAIKKKPKFTRALFKRGKEKFILKDYDGAINDYKQILKYDSDNTLALMHIGTCYQKLENYKTSITYYSKAIETKGARETNQPYLEMYIPFTGQRETDEFDFFVNKVVLKYARGISYMNLKDYSKAIEDFENSIQDKYNLANALYMTGEAYYYLKDTTNAKIFLKKAYENGATDTKHY